MVDRVKYFLLGFLFLVVAGVIAYDRWNSRSEFPSERFRDADGSDPVRIEVDHVPTPAPLPVPDPEPEPAPLPEPPAPRPAPEPAPVPPAPEPTPLPVPAPAPQHTHVVQAGESLETIAVRYYGTSRGVGWIVEANGLRDPNRIFVNQKLVIPARAESQPSGHRQAAPAPVARAIPSRYVVKDGDGDLYAICRRFYGPKGEGARVAEVMRINHLFSADVKAGTLLILPQK